MVDAAQPWPTTARAPDIEEIARRPAWMRQAACRTEPQGTFFPVRGENGLPAKAICAGCAVRGECLDYALADPELTGVWGGTTGRERRRLRARATAAVA